MLQNYRCVPKLASLEARKKSKEHIQKKFALTLVIVGFPIRARMRNRERISRPALEEVDIVSAKLEYVPSHALACLCWITGKVIAPLSTICKSCKSCITMLSSTRCEKLPAPALPVSISYQSLPIVRCTAYLQSKWK